MMRLSQSCMSLRSCLTLCDPMDSSPPWNSLGKGTGVGYHALLQGIFLTQGVNQAVLHSRQILYCWDLTNAVIGFRD